MRNDTCNTIFYFDGLCEPINPGGYACFGWVGYWKGHRARQGGGCIGHGAGLTNNIAEYAALIASMQFLLRNKYCGEVEFRGDSQLIVNQMCGAWQVKSPHLRRLHDRALSLSLKFSSVSYVWIPREQNQEADTMSRLAYKKARKP